MAGLAAARRRRTLGAAESLIDYSCCGTPLIELVAELDPRTPEGEMEKLLECVYNDADVDF